MSNIFRNRVLFKITLPALMVLLLFGIPAGFGLRYAQVTGETNSQVAIHNLELLQIGGLIKAVQDEQMLAHEVAHTSTSRTEALGRMTSAINGQEQLIQTAKEDVFASEEEEEMVLLEEFEQLHLAATGRFLGESAQAIELGDMARLAEEADVFKGTSGKMLGLLDSMTEICTLERDEATAVRDAALNRLGTAAIVSFIAASLLLLGVAALVSRWITRPLRQMVGAAAAMSRGDLGQRVETAARDEVGQLAGAFNIMADSLERRTGQLTKTNETIERRRAELEALNAVGEVAAGTLDLKEMTDAVLDKVLEVIKADAAAIHLLDEQAGEIVLMATRALPDVLAGDLKRLKPGQGCPGYVWEIGRILIEKDLRLSDKVPQSALDAGLLSYLGAPLTSKKEIVGVISLASGRLEGFDEDDARLLSLIGGHVGMAVENAYLYNKSVDHVARAISKNRIMSALTSSLDIDEVYSDFAAELKKLVDYSCVSITEQVNGQSLRVISSHGDKPGDCVAGFTFDAEGKPMLAAIESREPFVSGDIENDGRIMDKDFFERAGFNSIISMPLIAKDNVLGTMNMASNKKNAYDVNDVRELEPVVYQVALALDNQRLFKSVAKAKNEWETTFDSVSDGIVMVNEDHVVLRINQAAASLLGGAVEAFINRSCRDICPGFDEMVTECRNQAPVSESDSVTTEYLTEDGRVLEVMTDNIFDAGGSISGSVYILRDVTEARRLRRQLVQSEKMVAVGELVSGVAHEINNPLTGVLGYAQLLAARDIDEKAKNDAEGIMREAERATRIVRQLLSFARKHEPERSMTDVNAALMESVELKTYDMRVNNISLETELDESLPETMADKYQLQQVFLNIISNAEQAMLGQHEGGLLKISSRMADGSIRLAFADDGPGITEEIRNRVFDPFFTTKDVGKGTGLGLSVCYGVVEEHGGNIWVEPTSGGGATFVIELPVINEQAAPQKEVDKPDKEAVRPGKILLVDDEEGIRQALTRILRQAGHIVETADNGKTALAILKHDHFDCIVSDIKMPQMDGPTLHREAKLLDPRLGGSFIFISGDTINSKTQSYLDEVENPHLTKPFSASDLEDVLKKVLNGG